MLAFLQWAGWQAVPIARLGDDPAGVIVRTELERLGVTWSHVRHESKVGTPVIIQEFVASASGQPEHRFRFACPTCKGWLPRFTPPTIPTVRGALSDLADSPAVLYIDRACPAAIDAAKQVRASGGLVFFEPAGLGEPRLFERCARESTVLKFSHEHRQKFASSLARVAAPVEIETLGPVGLRLRTSRGGKKGQWRHLPAYEVPAFKDAAGAGDACTAGILICLHAAATQRRWSLSLDVLTQAAKFGQALASLNCRYLGARGLMRAATSTFAAALAQQLVEKRSVTMNPEQDPLQDDTAETLSCGSCEQLRL
ncbi:MAG: hypothetical protein IT435_00025 [Phycisphaerales bacterium]|nr:hypothetical protein [Phycisphaerales bacterium]